MKPCSLLLVGKSVIDGIKTAVDTDTDTKETFGKLVAEYAEIKDLKVYELNTGLDPDGGQGAEGSAHGLEQPADCLR